MTKRKTHFSEHQIRSPILPQPPNPPSIPQNKWQDIIHKQEHDILILEIREEILQKAFETYNKIHNDKKIARLLTDCALESWRRIVSLYFFQKDQPQLLEGSDATDEPCRADCVAGKNIPLNFTYTVPQSGTPKFSTDSLKSASQQGDKLLSHSEVQLVSSCSTMSCEELESMEEDYCFEMNEETFRDSYETFGSDLSDFSKLKLLPELQPEKRLQKLTVPKKRRRNTRLHSKRGKCWKI